MRIEANQSPPLAKRIMARICGAAGCIFTEVVAAIVGPTIKINSSIMLSIENAVNKTGPETSSAVQRDRMRAPIDGYASPLPIEKINKYGEGTLDGINRTRAIEQITIINICIGKTRCCPSLSTNLELRGAPIAAAIEIDPEIAPAIA